VQLEARRSHGKPRRAQHVHANALVEVGYITEGQFKEWQHQSYCAWHERAETLS
jgi:hypothetical protein